MSSGQLHWHDLLSCAPGQSTQALSSHGQRIPPVRRESAPHADAPHTHSKGMLAAHDARLAVKESTALPAPTRIPPPSALSMAGYAGPRVQHSSTHHTKRPDVPNGVQSPSSGRLPVLPSESPTTTFSPSVRGSQPPRVRNDGGARGQQMVLAERPMRHRLLHRVCRRVVALPPRQRLSERLSERLLRFKCRRSCRRSEPTELERAAVTRCKRCCKGLCVLGAVTPLAAFVAALIYTIYTTFFAYLSYPPMYLLPVRPPLLPPPAPPAAPPLFRHATLSATAAAPSCLYVTVPATATAHASSSPADSMGTAAAAGAVAGGKADALAPRTSVAGFVTDEQTESCAVDTSGAHTVHVHAWPRLHVDRTSQRLTQCMRMYGHGYM